MSAQGMSDLDELVLRCRSPRARQYVVEAVACYRGGAFRAAIVSTWIAVVLDILDKLHELELGGDRNARTKIERFEEGRAEGEAAGNWRKSNEFERGILDVARYEFELLTPAEHEELTRLRDDRNRCAHPSVVSGAEPYQPAAELARYHIRNAVEYLLSHPPVQGQAALDRVMQDIASTYFPREMGDAQDRLAAGPLARARRPLVRNLVLVLTKTLLLERGSLSERERKLSALAAIRNMHRAVVESTLQESLSGVVERVDDQDWQRVIWYVGSFPGSWDLLSPADQRKAHLFVAGAPDDSLAVVVGSALRIADLEEIARTRIVDIPTEALAEMVQTDPLPALVEGAVSRFAAADSFKEARYLSRSLLLPVAPMLTVPQVQAAVRAYVDNGQIHGSAGMDGVMYTFLEKTAHYAASAREEWAAIYEVLERHAARHPDAARLRRKIGSDVLLLPDEAPSAAPQDGG